MDKSPAKGKVEIKIFELYMKTKLFTFFLALVASAGTIMAESGTCGNNLTWELVDNVLTIRGEGPMYDWKGRDFDDTPWYPYREKIKSAIIGNGVTTIGASAFYECSLLKSVAIPNSVTCIKGGAFYDCGLTSITIPQSVTSIGVSAFFKCSKLTSITIPNSITSIPACAFCNCIWLKDVTIGNNVTDIGYEAFSGCKRIESITCTATTPPTCVDREGRDSIYNTFCEVNRSACKLYVLNSSVNLYKATGGWKGFKNILPIGATDVNVTDVVVEPTENSVVIQWPIVSGAYTYELVIKDKNGNIVCTLIFNAQGQLTQIAFNAPGRDNAPQQMQSTGFSYTVTGLESGTSYNMTITAKNSNGSTLDAKTVSFTTKGGESTAIKPRDISTPLNDTNKSIRNGQLYIQRGNELFNAQGARVK